VTTAQTGSARPHLPPNQRRVYAPPYRRGRDGAVEGRGPGTGEHGQRSRPALGRVGVVRAARPGRSEEATRPERPIQGRAAPRPQAGVEATTGSPRGASDSWAASPTQRGRTSARDEGKPDRRSRGKEAGHCAPEAGRPRRGGGGAWRRGNPGAGGNAERERRRGEGACRGAGAGWSGSAYARTGARQRATRDTSQKVRPGGCSSAVRGGGGRGRHDGACLGRTTSGRPRNGARAVSAGARDRCRGVDRGSARDHERPSLLPRPPGARPPCRPYTETRGSVRDVRHAKTLNPWVKYGIELGGHGRHARESSKTASNTCVGHARPSRRHRAARRHGGRFRSARPPACTGTSRYHVDHGATRGRPHRPATMCIVVGLQLIRR